MQTVLIFCNVFAFQIDTHWSCPTVKNWSSFLMCFKTVISELAAFSTISVSFVNKFEDFKAQLIDPE